MRLRRRLGLMALSLLVGLTSGRASAAPIEETAPQDLYLRHLGKIGATVDAIAAHAKRIGAKTVVVAFDRVTFAPPPGENEFDEEHPYGKDLPVWLAEFARAATATGLDVRAGSTTSSAWTKMTEAGAADRKSVV
jgi:hypothetical protein